MPYLYATAAKLSQLRRRDDELSATLKDAADWVDRSRQIARDLMNAISYPESAVRDPLRAAWEFIEEVLVRSGLAVSGESGIASAGEPGSSNDPAGPHIAWPCLVGDPPESIMAGRLDEPTGAAIYRIVTELVRNAVRHANANQIIVDAIQTDQGVRIEVRDDGSGFNPDALDKTTRHGLDWVRGRAEAVGWELQIESDEGGGTNAIVSGPIPA
ncbi:Nitrate/nitrite sensor protein NarX [Neorhodopirellula pilleata]|uniref:Nitrate/nitrite sensor protein NarX n=1 Tax=Neorhodopirellula pilleata TaxID=2714738 RepID=A0A5C6A428_9BACT|nr:Nitrate/nitrite sensor protein NarX [Neorhodopirellula pilleata]